MDRVQSLKVRQTIDLDNTGVKTLFESDQNMSTKKRIIQNVGNTDMHIALGTPDINESELGEHGELVLKPDEKFETYFMGKITAFRQTNASSVNNCIIIAF